MTLGKLMLIGTAALSLAACATEYHRPDTSEAQVKKDLEECKAIAYGENPGDWTPDGPDYQARNSVGCPSGDCQAERAVLACMESRGYSY